MVEGGCCFSSPGFQIASIASSLGAIASTRGQAFDFLSRSSNACTSVTSSMSDHRPSSVLTPTPQACNLSLCELAVSLQDHFTPSNTSGGAFDGRASNT